MTDPERARSLMEDCGFTCVLVKGDTVHASTARGIRPMVQFLSEGLCLSGFSASDKVVGKAPALLFVLADVKEVYAPVMSEDAVRVLQKYGVSASCGRTVPVIRNRRDTGPCPMELAVRNIEEPAMALEAVQETLLTLSGPEQSGEDRSHE